METNNIFRQIEKDYGLEAGELDHYASEQPNLVAYNFHGRANSMPKRIREYFETQGIVFADNMMVDITEWVHMEIVNMWEVGN